MRALRLLAPARAELSSTWQRTSRVFTNEPLHVPLPRRTLQPRPRPVQPLPNLRRPFTQTHRRANDWRNPRHRYEQLSRAKPLFSRDGARRVLRSPSLYTIVALSAVSATVFYFSNLQTVPVSGRRRFNCYSEAGVEAAAEQQVKRIKWEVERQGGRFLGESDPRTRMVKRVLSRLIPVSGMADSDWEVRVIDDPHTANAFVLPGGKVFVMSGLIPIARNEHGLAAVLGHEIAHNLAEHVGERMSSQIGTNILLWSLVFLTRGRAMPLFGGPILDLLFSKPMGRRQESEADYIGLMMMAEACYDPREAFYFWQRMERAHGTNEPPEWMSTHPSNHNRIEKIREWLPQAMETRAGSDCQGTSVFADQFRRALQQGFTMDSPGV